MVYVNPDDFLGHPRVFTEARNQEAWRACKDLIDRTLRETQSPYNFYLVCGVQGAGKTHWVKENGKRFVEPAIVLDATNPRARDRAGAIAQARRFSCRLICVWISCSLDVALARNRARSKDQVVPDDIIRLVFNDFEPPTIEEGFDAVLEITNV